jgi:sugar-specific transcriptional regulator TrmB
MRVTVQAAVDLIAERGPMTAMELAECFEVTIKRIHHSLGEWRTKKLIQRDMSDPPRYSFKPLSEIGRDEMGKLSEPKAGEPSLAEIRVACLEIQREWSPQEEYSRRMYKTEPVEMQRTGTYHDSHGGMDFS